MKTFTAKMKKAHGFALAALLGLGLMAGSASANIIVATQNMNPQTGSAPVYLDLDGTLAGVQNFKLFTTTVPNQLVRVIFNAEGAVGGAVTTWLNDVILIDGIAVANECSPSNSPAASVSNNALVSGNGTATANDGWFSGTTQCFRRIPNVGVHIVRVRATGVNPANAPWWIDDLSLVIDTQ
jgi:hypothetical protein